MGKSKIYNEKGSLESLLETDKGLRTLVNALAKEGCNPGVLPFRLEDDKIEEIADEAIEHLKNPNALADFIKEEPFFINPSVMLSLYILICIDRIDDYEVALWGRDYLKRLGLPGFMTKRIKNVTKNKVLYSMKQHPEQLIELVAGRKEALLKEFESCPKKCTNSRRAKQVLKPHGGPVINECCIEHAFMSLVNENMPEDFIDFDIPDMTVLTLRFLSYQFGVPFSSLYKFYYDISKT